MDSVQTTTLSTYVPPSRKRSWIVDSLVMLLFAVTVGFLLIALGRNGEGEANASQDNAVVIHSTEPARELPPIMIRGAGKAASSLPDPFSPEDRAALQEPSAPLPQIHITDEEDAYAAESKVLHAQAAPVAQAAKASAKPSVDASAISLEDQREILKIISGEASQ